MSVASDLMRAEWAARKRAYVVLLVLFASTSATYAMVLALVGGLEDRIGGELSDNLASDLRVSNGAQGVADGDMIPNASDVLLGLRAAAAGTRTAPRLEVEGLFAHGGGFTTGRFEAPNVSRSAGILIGIDPAAEVGVVDLSGYLTRGVWLDAAPAYETPQGERVTPIVVGERFLETSNATVATGVFSWDAVFNVTAGRLENNQLVTTKAIVVGAYSTGFRMIDRAVVYAPRGEVARLVGQHPGDPPANVILVSARDVGAVSASAHRLGLTTMPAQEFRETYLGPVFTTVRVVAWAIVGVLTMMTAGWFAHTLGHHVAADRRKIATLRAIGVPTQTFAQLYVGLAIGLGAAGAALGLAAALLLGLVVRAATSALSVAGPRPFAPQFALAEAVGLVALAVATSALAAVVALRRLRGQSIRDALRGGP